VSSLSEGFPKESKVRGPSRAGHQLDGSLLERAGHEELIDQPHRGNPLQNGTPTGDRPHSETRRGCFRQRDKGHHVPISIISYQWRGRRRSVIEPPRPIIFEQKGASSGGDGENL
jgi:hypothetical protein